MIRVHKIAHASYETPDVDKQADYYTDVIGLTLVAKEKDTIFLSSTVDHHAVVLRKGPTAQCARIAFQISPESDLGEFEKQVESHGIKTQRKKELLNSMRMYSVFACPIGSRTIFCLLALQCGSSHG